MRYEIELGSRVKDKVTGFSGIVVAVTIWLTGCVRYAVRPEELREGKRIEDDWFDEIELDVVDEPHAILRTKPKPKERQAGPPTRGVEAG